MNQLDAFGVQERYIGEVEDNGLMRVPPSIDGVAPGSRASEKGLTQWPPAAQRYPPRQSVSVTHSHAFGLEGSWHSR